MARVGVARDRTAGGLAVVLVAAFLFVGESSAVRDATEALVSVRSAIRFEENLGQTHPDVAYLARTDRGVVFFAPTEVVFSTETASVVRLRMRGSEPHPEITGAGVLPGSANYITHRSRVAGARSFSRIRYANAWSGIDVVFYEGQAGNLEFDLVVSPGADPRRAAFEIAGARGIDVRRGDVMVASGAEPLIFSAPRAFQTIDGRRVTVGSRFVARGSVLSFDVGRYDRTRTLTIDPQVLGYSTFLGGVDGDFADGVAVDDAGNAYVTGDTTSVDYPVCAAAGVPSGCAGSSFDTTLDNRDVFVTKVRSDGTGIVYSTFLGGKLSDIGRGIAVDVDGSAYVTGNTSSAEFPVCTAPGVPVGCPGPSFDTTLTGVGDAFVTKLAPDGASLEFSTFLGGQSEDEFGDGIAVDAEGAAYVVGTTDAPDFPVCTAPGAPSGCPDASFETAKRAGDDVFVTKLANDGANLKYSTFLGSDSNDAGIDIAVDDAGSAYVVGGTSGTDVPFPVCTGVGTPTGCSGPGFDTTPDATSDAFVTKLPSDGAGLVYSTFLGAAGGFDIALGVAVDSADDAYVVGDTVSAAFPVCTAAGSPTGCAGPSFDTSFNGVDDGFVTKFNITGTQLLYSTYLGSSASDSSRTVAVDSSHRAYVTGFTQGADFPVCTAAGAPPGCDGPSLQPTIGGGFDAYATTLTPEGSAVASSTYLGGEDFDRGTGIAVDASGAAYVAGATVSTNFPVCTAAGTPPGCIGSSFDPSHNGAEDAFVTKVQSGAGPTIAIDDVAKKEGDRGTRKFKFTVSLSAASAETVTVDFTTADDTAIAGSDYRSKIGTIVFTPGVVAKSFKVRVNGDRAAEGNEVFRVELSNPTNAVIGDPVGEGTILDDD